MSLKCKIDNPVTVGFETKLTLASVTTHKVPSEPTRILVKSSPTTPFDVCTPTECDIFEICQLFRVGNAVKIEKIQKT